MKSENYVDVEVQRYKNIEMRFLCSVHQELNRQLFFFFALWEDFFLQTIEYDLEL